jgi:hypothetical protein
MEKFSLGREFTREDFPMYWPCGRSNSMRVALYYEYHRALRLLDEPIVEFLEGKWDSRRNVEQ